MYGLGMVTGVVIAFWLWYFGIVRIPGLKPKDLE
jgi:hypothetical protein